MLRRFQDVLLTLAPLLLAGPRRPWHRRRLGLPLNFANIIALPLLLGIGVAFNIYFVMAWRGGSGDLLQSSLTRAILFSALTTGTAFGSLWLSNHPGTASMGELLTISLVCTLVCALLFLPALLGPAKTGALRPKRRARPLNFHPPRPRNGGEGRGEGGNSALYRASKREREGTHRAAMEGESRAGEHRHAEAPPHPDPLPPSGQEEGTKSA